MENVVVIMEPTDSDLAAELVQVATVPISKLAFDEPASTYVAFKKTKGKGSFSQGSFSTTLKFISKDCDPNSGEVDEEGYDDLYQVSFACFLLSCLFFLDDNHIIFSLVRWKKLNWY